MTNNNFIYDYSTQGITNVWIAEWNSDLDWVNSINLNKIRSTIISGYTTTLTWYELPVDPQVTNFTQTLEQVRQGFIFNDILTMGVGYYNSNKFSGFQSLLSRRWVVIFKDNNGNYWTFGYKNGAEVTNYNWDSENAGILYNFTAVSDNKIITAISDNYINDNIL